MADPRRWNAGSGARRHDDFTQAPAFRDGHDSAPLTASASWHGSGSRHVALAVGLALIAAAAAVAFMVLDPGAGPVADPSTGSAANGAGGAIDAPVGGGLHEQSSGNVTSSLPSPLPSLPPTP